MASRASCVACLTVIVTAITVSSSSKLHNHRRLDQLLDFFSSSNLQEALARDQKDPTPSSACRAEMGAYMDGLRDGEPWADRIFDATGRYSSQFLFGNDFFLGSQALCIELSRNHSLFARDQEKKDPSSFLRWRVRPPPFQVSFQVVKLKVTLPLQRFQENIREVSLGLCLPEGCSPEDGKALARAMAEEGDGGVPPKSVAVQVVSSRRVPGGYSMWTDVKFHMLAIAGSMVLLLIATGTLLDLTKAKNRGDKRLFGSMKAEGNSGRGEVREEPYIAPYARRPSLEFMLLDVMLCFSVARNAMKILRGAREGGEECEGQKKECEIRRRSSLSCLHGLRVFSLLWIILGHTCHISFLYSDNKHYRAVVERDFLFQTVGNGPYAVDTFFFISGLLLSFLYFRSSSAHYNTTTVPGKPVTPFSPPEPLKNRVLRFGTLVAYRMVRLTPPYLFVIGAVEVTMKCFRSESVFEPPTDDDVNCPNYWWRNALYINTLFPVKEMCMIWSWYLADDTQFYIIGLLILMLSSSHFKMAAFSAGMILLGSWMAAGFIALKYDYTPRISEPLALFDELYDKPWTRIGPHIIGLATGWILHRTNCKMNISKVTVIIGWLLSICVCFILIYGIYGKTIGPIPSAIYAALSHSAWAVALLWLVTACAADKGGWINTFLSGRPLGPFSRLTYCAYLVHPIIIRASVAHLDSPMHISRDSFAFLFAGHVIASYFLAFVVSVALESPIISVLKMAISNRRHQ